MSASEPESNGQEEPATRTQKGRLSLVGLLVLAAVLLPASTILVAWSLIIIANNLDVAYALGLPDAFVNGLVTGLAGLITGLVVALVSNMRGWRLAAPPLAGLIVGVGIYIGFRLFEPGEVPEVGGLELITIATGQLVAILASTRISGLPLVGVSAVILALGVGFAGFIQAMPEAPAEVMLVLDVYAVDDTSGECSGANELAGIGAGSHVLLIQYDEASGEPMEVGSVVLAEGFEADGGCRFDLGNPLDRPVGGYERIDFLPESDPNVPYSILFEGNRVIVTLNRAEG